MLETVTRYIEQHRLVPASGHLVVAVSGGADSLCLLHLLNGLCGPGRRFPHVRLHVAHLNHQLRGAASSADAEAVADLARAWQLPYTIGSCDVPALARLEQRSLEDAARSARYRFLREVASTLAHARIAVAHHLDDQVETLLLHWLRGGGLGSMVGLQPAQRDIVRPLLAVTHADTLTYCQQHQLVPLEDASNTDTRFLRNRIRHELLPLLEAMNPGFRATLLRNAEIMQVDLAWIEAQVDEAWPQVVTGESDHEIKLAIADLLVLPLSIQRHLLRRVTGKLSEGQSPLELRHYKLLEALMRRDQGGETAMLHFPHHLRVVRHNDTLIFTYGASTVGVASPYNENSEVELPIPGNVEVPGTNWIATAELLPEPEAQAIREALDAGSLLSETPYTVYIAGDTLDAVLWVRTRRRGDRLRPLGMAHEKKVQDIFVDNHVERGEREHIPLFFSAQHCVWLAGIQIDDRVRLTDGTQRIIRLAIQNRPSAGFS